MNFVTRVKLLVLESFYTRKFTIRPDFPIFTFTFDDVPKSAGVYGAQILEEVGAKGTFYVALGLTAKNAADTSGDYNQYLESEDILSLYNRGHDIGCHSYSHLNLRELSPLEIVKDCERNTKALSNIISIDKIPHFSYPLGKIGIRGKGALAHRYKTLRSTDPGINYGSTDLGYLRSVSIYSKNFSESVLLSLIQKTRQVNGWTIFYTHDIDENPTIWGTKKSHLSWLVNQCSASKGRILSVAQAIKAIEKESTGTQP